MKNRLSDQTLVSWNFHYFLFLSVIMGISGSFLSPAFSVWANRASCLCCLQWGRNRLKLLWELFPQTSVWRPSASKVFQLKLHFRAFISEARGNRFCSFFLANKAGVIVINASLYYFSCIIQFQRYQFRAADKHPWNKSNGAHWKALQWKDKPVLFAFYHSSYSAFYLWNHSADIGLL